MILWWGAFKISVSEGAGHILLFHAWRSYLIIMIEKNKTLKRQNLGGDPPRVLRSHTMF